MLNPTLLPVRYQFELERKFVSFNENPKLMHVTRKHVKGKRAWTLNVAKYILLWFLCISSYLYLFSTSNIWLHDESVHEEDDELFLL